MRKSVFTQTTFYVFTFFLHLTMYKGAYRMMDIKSNKVFPSKSSYVRCGFCVIEHEKPTFTHMMYQNNPGVFINLY